jgi:HEAT repeat protein
VAIEVFGLCLMDDWRASIVPGGRRERCVRALGWAALGPWLTLVIQHHRDEWVRRDAIRALGEIEPSESVPALLEALRGDVSEAVRGVAAEALGSAGASEALAPLVAALRTDSSDSVRCSAARALRHLADESAAEPLREAVRGDPAAAVRREAAAMPRP